MSIGFKKGLFSILLVILLANTVLAVNIDLEITPVQNKVVPNQNAVFRASITNNENREMTFEFAYLDIFWRIENDRIQVPAGSTKAMDLVFVPQKEEKPELLTVIVSSDDKTFRQERLLRLNLVDYKDVIKTEPEIPNPLDPRRSSVIKLKVVNLQDFSFNSLRVNVKSEFFDKDEVIDLDPFETKTLDFPIEFMAVIEEGTYTMGINLFYKEKLVKEESLDINIGSFPDLKEIVSPKSSLLYKRIEVTKENNGNTDSYEIYTKELSLFQRLFTNSQPKPTKITRSSNGYMYSWQFKLEPGEIRTIVIETDYRLGTTIFVIILIILFVVYYFTKTDVFVSKKVMDIVTDKNGVTRMKIMINVRNKSINTLRNVKVLDRLPVVINSPDSFGTAHPKIIKSDGGTKLVWDILALSKKEERIFSYNASYKLSVIGQLNIPKTLIRYRSGVRNIIVRSKPIKLFH